MRGRIYRRGTTWSYIVDVPVSGGKRRKQASKGGFKSRRAAEQALRELLRLVDVDAYVEPSKLTVGEYLVETWLPAIRLTVRPGTWAGYAADVRRHVLPHLGAVPLQALKAAKLNALYAFLLHEGGSRGAGLSPKSVRNVHGVLHKALKDAVRWGLVLRNVADQVDPPRKNSPEMRVWTGEQLRRFLDHVCDDRLFAAWMVAATTGMRRGEVLGLRWQDVDLAAARVSIRQASTVVDYEVRASEPKTKRSRRSIALDPRTVAALRVHRQQQLEERLLVGPAWQDHDLVFAWCDGSPIHPQRFSKWFAVHAERAGLPRIRLHDLRHSYATAALGAGVPARIVSDRLGHSNIGTTLDIYSHVLPSMDEQAAVQVADAIFGSREQVVNNDAESHAAE